MKAIYPKINAKYMNHSPFLLLHNKFDLGNGVVFQSSQLQCRIQNARNDETFGIISTDLIIAHQFNIPRPSIFLYILKVLDSKIYTEHHHFICTLLILAKHSKLNGNSWNVTIGPNSLVLQYIKTNFFRLARISIFNICIALIT